jgi:CHAT domain-containing protein/tetratricopeptide (TPR) repeat protein
MDFISTTLSAKRLRLACLLALITAFGLDWQLAHAQTTTSQQIEPLSANQTISKEIRGGQSHRFGITLTAGQFVQIVVEQQGIDVKAAAFKSPDEKIIEVDLPNGYFGPEVIFLTATQQTNYVIQVSADTQTVGHYELRVEGPREKSADDDRRIEAQRLFAEAQRQRSKINLATAETTISTYQQALNIWRELNDARMQGYTLCNIGRVYRYLGGSKLKESLTAFEQAGVALTAAHDTSGRAFVLNEIGATYRDLADPADALASYEQALTLRAELGDVKGQAQLFNNIGLVYDRIGHHYQAIENYDKALALWQSVDDKNREHNSLNNIALAYQELGELQLAFDKFNQVLKFAQTSKDVRLEANVRNSLGVIYDTWADSQSALDNYESALAIFRQLKDPRNEAHVLENIGMLYVEYDDPQRALQHLQSARSIRETFNEPRGLGIVLHHIGTAYMLLGQYQEALTSLDRGRKASTMANDQQFVAYTLVSMGLVHVELGENTKALDYYQQALKLQETIEDRRGQAITLDKMGQVYGRLNQPARAVENFDQALTRWQELNDRQGKALTFYGLARVERDQNKLREASAHGAEAIRIVESLRSTITSYQLRVNYFAARQDYYDLDIDTRMQIAQAIGSKEDAAAALSVAERARARSFIDLLVDARAEIRADADQQLTQRSRKLEEEISALGERLIRVRNDSVSRARLRVRNESNQPSIKTNLRDRSPSQDSARMEAHYQELVRELDENEAKIRARSPSYARVKRSETLSAQQIQHLLDADTVLLEFALGERRSYLWFVTPTEIASFQLPKRLEVEKAVSDFRKAIIAFEPQRNDEPKAEYLARSNAALARYHEAGKKLSEIVLGQVWSKLGNRRVVIVADGALQYVPFEALLIPGPNAAPLLSQNEIIYQPSASTLALIRDRPPHQANKSVAIFADPVFDSGDGRVPAAARRMSTLGSDLGRALRDLGDDGAADSSRLTRLFFSAEEADAIYAVAAPGSAMKMVSFAASRAAALNPDLKSFRIVHFATHGILNDQHPELSGIVLSLVNEQGEPQNGFLQLRDVYNLSLPAKLVVLSACRTALGKQVRGEGLIGLTRGFMFAGASRVVASLWKVDDAATAELMKRFYVHMLKDNTRPAAALRQAQLELMNSGPRWKQPYYWAAFTLQGEWR